MSARAPRRAQPRLPPATYYMRRSPVPPIVVYTDAAFEPDDPRPAGLGACVYDPLAPVEGKAVERN
eukprot:scaffold16054_cov127-Isochrysis_galbana.AAC.1